MDDLNELAQAAAQDDLPPRRTSYESVKRGGDEAKLWLIVVACAVGVFALIALIVAINQPSVDNTYMGHPDAGVGGPEFFGVGGDKK